MIRMEITRTEKETVKNRMKDYQQRTKRKEVLQHDRSKSICGRRHTADQ